MVWITSSPNGGICPTLTGKYNKRGASIRRCNNFSLSGKQEVTVSTTTNSVTIGGTGSLTAFVFPFVGVSASDISIIYTAADGTTTTIPSSQYTLSLNVPLTGQIWGVGGTVTYPISGSAIAAGTTLTIKRTLPVTQETAISNQGDFYPEVVEAALDTLCMEIQQAVNGISKAVSFPASDSSSLNAILPAASARANKYAAFDSSGNVIASAAPSGTPTDLSTYYATASSATTSITLAKRSGFSVTPYDFGAVGDGVADDTAAVQACLNATAESYVPVGTFNCIIPVTVSNENKRIFGGGGELRFTAGIAGSAAITVSGDFCYIQGLWVSNPNQLGNKTTGAASNKGIFIAADDCTVVGCYVDKFQFCISVSETGEFFRTKIHDNTCVVIGAGAGPSDPTSTDGEDRGDGITCWGAGASIVGNIVTTVGSGSNTDCRIGIHCEGLPASEVTSPTYSDTLYTVCGNVVYGTFRRDIVFESVKGGTLTGNTVAGAKWWNIALIYTRSCVVSGNSCLYDRLSSDQTGLAYSPEYVPIMVYGNTDSSNITGNSVYVTGNALAGIALQGLSASGSSYYDDRTNDTVVDSNNIYSPGYCRYGVKVQYSDSFTVRNNNIRGVYDMGVYTYHCTDKNICGNSVDFVNKYQTRLVLASIVGGPFTSGEIITGSVSGATGTLIYEKDTGVSLPNYSLSIQQSSTVANTAYTIGETVTGTTSGAYGVVSTVNQYGYGIYNEGYASDVKGTKCDGNKVSNFYKGIGIINTALGSIRGNLFFNGISGIDTYGSTYIQQSNNGFSGVTTRYANQVGVGMITLDDYGYRTLYGSATYVIPSIAAGASSTITTLTITGAVLGDSVTATFNVDTTGLQLIAWVSATNTVSVTFFNPTSGTINIGSGTLAARIAPIR